MASGLRQSLSATRRRRAGALAGLAGALLLGAGCGGSEPLPNVLWIVWDTVRADRLGIYGGERPTTPNVDRWAQGARLFEDVLAVGATTVPNHAAMFTGLLPAQHGATNATPWLDDAHATIAERLSAVGYRTYLWAANPHITPGANFTRGFERAEHPWDPAHQRGALALARAKANDGSGLAAELEGARISTWAVKDSSTLAQSALLEWLDALPDAEPWFAFLNYMEAHRPVVPERRFRRQVMDPAQLERSYSLDRGWLASWSYTFGLSEYDEQELDTISAVYDAALAELDDLFGQLLVELERRGELWNSVVILTSDHGEHLGEHHMLDHQYSLHEPVLRVPLVIRYPERFAPGRETRPVMNFDLFPTLLELAGIGAAEASPSRAVSLLSPRAGRLRLAEYRAPFELPIDDLRKSHPDFDFSPWQRRLRALSADGYKLVEGSDGRDALYHTTVDPGETRDLQGAETERARRMHAQLDAIVASLDADEGVRMPSPRLSPEERARLEALGYGQPGAD